MKRLLPFGILFLAVCGVVSIFWPRGDAVGQDAAPQAKGAKPAETGDTPNYVKDIKPFLEKNCYECHNNKKKRGGLSFEKYSDDESLQKDRTQWEEVIHRMAKGEMPPKEGEKDPPANPRPQPSMDEVGVMVRHIETVLNNLDCGKVQNVGRVTIRRLNKNEYNNTIRDLVGVDFKPAADFPNDDVGYGFDNIGDVLSISPVLLERYLTAAEAILEKGIVLPDYPATTKQKLTNYRGAVGMAPKKSGYNNILKTQKPITSEEIRLFEGDYILRTELAADQAGDDPVKATLKLSDKESKSYDVPNAQAKPLKVEWRVHVSDGTYKISLSLDNPFKEAEQKVEPPKEEPKKDEAKSDAASGDKEAAPAQEPPPPPPPPPPPKERALYMKNIDVEGPFDPPPPPLPPLTAKLFAHAPDLAPRDAAKEILTRFATKAYRRPVTTPEVEGILKLYDKAAASGERFEKCVKMSMYRVLVSPYFLFRVELDPENAKAGEPYRISEFELATRLSYFLWSTMPDEELFGLAAKGELRKNLEAQVQRMLKDAKSDAYIQNFSSQWLTTRNLAYISPDPKVFPEFDEELRQSMYTETEMFFGAMVREDHSIFDMLDANFTYVNERLAKHYGIPDIKGKAFQKVELPANRRGILTQASILTITSYPERTTAVKRGKWVLDQLLNLPPPPPPDDIMIPPLDEAAKQLKGSQRQVMELHRTNAICASCHAKFDPLGFAFENFDAIGRWRDKEGEFDIDTSGVLPDGKTFKGPLELITIIKSKKELFGRAFTEKMLIYALGRGLEVYDRCTVDQMLGVLEKNDYRFSSIFLEVVKSEPFQMRTASGGKQ